MTLSEVLAHAGPNPGVNGFRLWRAGWVDAGLLRRYLTLSDIGDRIMVVNLGRTGEPWVPTGDEVIAGDWSYGVGSQDWVTRDGF